jgi:hypothetical protein
MAMMRIAAAGFLVVGAGGLAAESGTPTANVDYGGYARLVAEVEPHRAQRLVDLDAFLDLASRPDVVILDSRPAYRFERLHIEGAQHLDFSDFTRESLAAVIPSPDTLVLMYCKNNFAGDAPDFPTKVAPAAAALASVSPGDSPAPLMLALNVPTYLHLYGYGYRNVYELSELVAMDDPRIRFAGSRAGRLAVPGGLSPVSGNVGSTLSMPKKP